MDPLTRPPLPARRVLVGPGPSEVPERVRRAMFHPIVGHLDPDLAPILAAIRSGLRDLFGTRNDLTLAVPGTGTAGMEACLLALIEPEDPVLVCVAGYFGARIAEVAARCGARVHTLEVPWGEAVPPDRVRRALDETRPRLLALVHVETSTGVLQPIQEIARATRENGALTLLDCVTSLGGIPVELDAWGVDAAFSCSQKCVGAPPGLAPVSLGPRALERIEGRHAPLKSFYLDLCLLSAYWAEGRVYHHTAPVSLLYALEEALAVIEEEGLQARYARHLRHHRALVAGLARLGLEMLPAEEHRSPTLQLVRVPEGIDDGALRELLLREHAIEIGAGLGPTRGKVWRIGLMGGSSTAGNVLLLLSALEQTLSRLGGGPRAGGREAALEILRG